MSLHYEDFLTEDDALFLYKLGRSLTGTTKPEPEIRHFRLLMQIAEKAYEKGFSVGYSQGKSDALDL